MGEFTQEVRDLLLSLAACFNSHLANDGAMGGWWLPLPQETGWPTTALLYFSSEPLSLELKIAKDGSTRTCCPSLP